MWTSDPPSRALRLVLILLLPLVATAPGWWGNGKKDPAPEPQPEPETTAEPAPEPPSRVPPADDPDEPAPPPIESLFPEGLPVVIGPVPDGLANDSAQGCNACHWASHDAWAGSTHATGWAEPAFQAAVAEAGSPACTVCHQPLVAQAIDLAAYAGGDPNTVERTPNPTFDATLFGEGVTCAACHVRDGAVVASAPPRGEAPHPVVWSETLGQSAFCATCHQLTWPGADKPFYDTWGEWERSPQAAAGIQCQDCHMGAGATAGAAPDHAFPAVPGRGLSLLIDVDGVDLARGGNPLTVTLRLQNTGAGHAIPTGSPFQSILLKARLVSPPQVEGDLPVERALFEEVLGRTLSEEPPWTTLDDTRLQAGGERRFTWQPALSLDDPGGTWLLEVTLTRAVRGEPEPAPFVARQIPLRVD